ncbi:MAG: nucleoside triphosphate pyrophosphatase [Beijerinckiaceae bacterium]|nr:nucleoside triphosphate pyrophosphatase [Beijerinckiaceae bacterium]
MQAVQHKLWLADEPLVLASRSKARRAMLTNAGIPIDVIPSDVDEPFLQQGFGPNITASEIAVNLANAKAADVSYKHPSRLVLGSDQTLELDGMPLAKAESRAEAKERLALLSGRQHHLYSAFSFVRSGEVLHSGVHMASISMRTLGEKFIDAYLDMIGDSVLASVAVYEVEGMGAQMIQRIEGDWFTIQGLPLTPVIAFLQHQRFLLT